MIRLTTLMAIFLLALAGCTLPGAGAPPVSIDLDKVVASLPENGVVRVQGLPGSVVGTASTVTLTITREPPRPLRLLHLSGELPVSSGFAVVEADGSFKPTSFGQLDRPVLLGDELNVTPILGIAQVGYLVFKRIQ